MPAKLRKNSTLVASRSWRYDQTKDQFVGTTWPGALSNGFHEYMIDELELGGRVAIALDDPFQFYGILMELEMRRYETCYECKDFIKSPTLVDMVMEKTGKSFLELIEWYHDRQHRLWGKGS